MPSTTVRGWERIARIEITDEAGGWFLCRVKAVGSAMVGGQARDSLGCVIPRRFERRGRRLNRPVERQKAGVPTKAKYDGDTITEEVLYKWLVGGLLAHLASLGRPIGVPICSNS